MLRNKKHSSDGPLKATILEHMIYTERRLKVLGELFNRFGMELHHYLRKYKKKLN